MLHKNLIGLLVLAACTTDASSDLAAPPATLTVSSLVTGEPATLSVVGANPNRNVYFGLGDAGPGACFGSVCLDIVNEISIGLVRADASGAAVLSVDVPSTAPLGERTIQAGSPGASGFVSNAVTVAITDGIDIFGAYAEVEIQNHELLWEGGTVEPVIWFDNDLDSLITDSNGVLVRYDWDTAGEFLCVVADGFDVADLLAAPSVDFDNPGGCPSGLISLDAQSIALDPSYTDAFGTDHVITDTAWGQSSPFFVSDWEITRYSNFGSWAIAQNSASNGFFPNDWSRFDWTEDAAGAVYYCQTAFAAPTMWDALQTPRASEDLATGCGGFSWTRLSP